LCAFMARNRSECRYRHLSALARHFSFAQAPLVGIPCHALTMSKWVFWCDSAQLALAMWALNKDAIKIIVPPRLITIIALQLGGVLALNHADAAGIWDYLHDMVSLSSSNVSSSWPSKTQDLATKCN
ncbi:hypothetical protein, partial [Shewanella algae]|uniref:hypothetical protein n=1 Tax=Shewanella algae TaxID=38313 RepID=UPI001C9204B2